MLLSVTTGETRDGFPLSRMKAFIRRGEPPEGEGESLFFFPLKKAVFLPGFQEKNG
jgi:hypothetical protein